MRLLIDSNLSVRLVGVAQLLADNPPLVADDLVGGAIVVLGEVDIRVRRLPSRDVETVEGTLGVETHERALGLHLRVVVRPQPGARDDLLSVIGGHRAVARGRAPCGGRGMHLA